jgi:mannose-1-phosphate guanylyltransferase
VKAFLLAAGYGSRLRPLTDSIPKCMVPIRGVPLLSIWLESCKRIGIEEVLINLHAHAETVSEFLERNANGLRVRVAMEPQLLGSAGTLRANRDWIAGDDLFWVFYADVLNCVDLRSMMRMHQSKRPAATLGVYEVPDPRRCGIVTTDDEGIIQEFVEKPERPTGNLAFSGLMIGTQQLLDVIPEDVPADIGFHVLPKLTGRMLAYPIHEYLLDIGTMENYEKAQATWPGFTEAGFAKAGFPGI